MAEPINKVHIRRSGGAVVTEGLSQVMPEICVPITDLVTVPEVESFVRFVVDYQQQSGRRVRAEETLAYGYWLVKFLPTDHRYLQVWEYNREATEFVPGIGLAMTYWREQHRICDQFGAMFTPPRPDRLTVVDDGVLDGLPAQAVRYPSPEHMSGWWITSDRYSGDVNTLRREHTYHVTATRPDLAKYLALPFGFRFDLSSHEDVWRDERVTAQTAN